MSPSSIDISHESDQAILVYTSNLPNEKNEDRHSDDTFYAHNVPVRVLGVYDGHGGPWTSEYISHALPKVIKHNIQHARAGSSSIPDRLIRSFEQIDQEIVESVETRFAPVLSSTRYNIPFARQRNDRAKRSVVDLMLQDQNHLDMAMRAKAGSTALVACIDQTDIHVANVGDCRAVLARRDARTQKLSAIPLSIDQDGQNPGEYARVIREHPRDSRDPFVGGRLFGLMPLTR
ncbi:protein serine threonine phosphatase 2C [Apiospora arundinis]